MSDWMHRRAEGHCFQVNATECHSQQIGCEQVARKLQWLVVVRADAPVWQMGCWSAARCRQRSMAREGGGGSYG